MICADYKIWGIDFLIIPSSFAPSPSERFTIRKKTKKSESNSYIFRPISPSTWCTLLRETKKGIVHREKKPLYVQTYMLIAKNALSQNTRYFPLYFFFLGTKLKTLEILQKHAFLVICTARYHGKNLVFISVTLEVT